MKKLLLIIIPLIFFSCSKECKQCTRTWTYHSYSKNGSGDIFNVRDTDGGTETFEVCGDLEIENAEKTIKTNTVSGLQHVEGTGTCSCN